MLSEAPCLRKPSQQTIVRGSFNHCRHADQWSMIMAITFKRKVARTYFIAITKLHDDTIYFTANAGQRGLAILTAWCEYPWLKDEPKHCNVYDFVDDDHCVDAVFDLWLFLPNQPTTHWHFPNNWMMMIIIMIIIILITVIIIIVIVIIAVFRPL